MAGKGHVPKDLTIADSASDAVRHADILCTATTATKPVFLDSDVRKGTHINAVGTFRPDMQEIPSATVARAVVIVDSRTAIWAESGDLITPFHEGVIQREHVRAELGELVLGHQTGRTGPDEITLFKTVGIAVQDAAAARLAWANARERRIGQSVVW
jgi:ornithine cyclodeaminase/alanine dehydrogenase-like protein (mu-crystallin family)